MPRLNIANLQDIPNVGKAVEKDLVLLGVSEPKDLIGKDPYKMYNDLCAITAVRHDPCVIDVFIFAVKFMEGGPPKKWWEFTSERKKQMAESQGS